MTGHKGTEIIMITGLEFDRFQPCYKDLVDKDLVDDGYLFQQLAFEIQGAVGPGTENFLGKFCKNISI